MASQVKVIDPSLRQVIIKTSPGKYLSEIRDEACTKLRLDPEQYMLKRNDKTIDLSLTYRLSGLPSGSKLELIQRSKSPSVLSVALQIPSDISPDGQPTRLIAKFPNDKTLWQILRTFESGNLDNSNRSWNFTERSVKHKGSENEFYAFPKLHVMGRDHASIEDLQKTLAQLGFSDGNVLLKLELVPTQKTLQQAKSDMQSYFVATAPAMSTAETETRKEEQEAIPVTTAELANATNDASTVQSTEAQIQSQTPQEPATPTTRTISSRPTTVYRPPTRDSPLASTLSTNESDFEPTIDAMRSHQSSINNATRNKRLLTDAEILAQEKAADAKLALVSTVDVKIVLPDQLSVMAPFTRDDTSKELYAYVRSLLRYPDAGFNLSYAGTKGLVPLSEQKGERLIADLKFTGRVLARVLWAEDTGLDVRQNASLKDEVRKLAAELEIKDFGAAERIAGGTAKDDNKDEKEKKSGGGSGSRVPKWLKLPGKK